MCIIRLNQYNDSLKLEEVNTLYTSLPADVILHNHGTDAVFLRQKNREFTNLMPWMISLSSDFAQHFPDGFTCTVYFMSWKLTVEPLTVCILSMATAAAFVGEVSSSNDIANVIIIVSKLFCLF